jgi:hypothetical protein
MASPERIDELTQFELWLKLRLEVLGDDAQGDVWIWGPFPVGGVHAEHTRQKTSGTRIAISLRVRS